MPAPPESEAELFERARGLAGRSLGEVSAELGIACPDTLKRAKGFVGMLLERALGATAGSKDVPDFPDLGVELKSLPVDREGKPRESTFVCTMPLSDVAEMQWLGSRVQRKLARVLFVPVEATPEVAIAARRIGGPILWTASAEEEAALRRDWDELAGLVGAGHVESVTAHLGEYLQVRPKAAHSRVRTLAPGGDDGLVSVNPKGFYLRTKFTAAIVARALR
ncbi:MAG: DNA mismatch repair endonuclease MutH [Deltaproteobacteria bacterium]|nr:MAG: DNA mismatch repair endonuclease MutH [Deltaproteobacteria bacterium]